MQEVPDPEIHINMGRSPEQIRERVVQAGQDAGEIAVGEEVASPDSEAVEPRPLIIKRIGNVIITQRPPEQGVEQESTEQDYMSLSKEISGGEELDTPSIIERLTDSSLGRMIDKYGSYGSVLGGQVRDLTEGAYHLNPKARAENPYDSKKHGILSPKKGFSRPWETGVNINELIEQNPEGRFKFYLSLDLSTPDKEARAQDFMKKVWEKAAESEIAMLTKPEDHTYDSCNIYTWNPKEMAGIVKDLYVEFPDIWLGTEHPLQGKLEGVDPMHIGFVQEPIGGHEGASHSARMGKIGEFIDEAKANGEEFSPELYKEACAYAGVEPAAPWLIAQSN